MDDETNIFLAALRARLEMPTNVVLIHRGMAGLSYGAASVGQVCNKIINDYLSGELAERLAASE